MAGRTGGGPDRCCAQQGGYAERAVVSESGGLLAAPGDPSLRQGLARRTMRLRRPWPRNAAIRPASVPATGAAGGPYGGSSRRSRRRPRRGCGPRRAQAGTAPELGADAVDYSAPEWA